MRKREKALKFVEHIEQHLKYDRIPLNNMKRFSEDAKVMCKICGKTIDEIAKESKKDGN